MYKTVKVRTYTVYKDECMHYNKLKLSPCVFCVYYK